MANDASESQLRARLQASADDPNQFGQLLNEFRPRLNSMVAFRMHLLVRGRVDPSDVIQDAMIDATGRLNEYLAGPKVPFYIWLRGLVTQRLAIAHRHHLSVQGRSALRERSLELAEPAASSALMAAHLVGKLSSPSSAALAAEQKQRLQVAIDALDAIDREIIVLRHFEELSNSEAATVLGLQPTAANNRYVRALGRLKAVLITRAPETQDHAP